MTARREQSDNSSASSRRNSDCLTALFLFLTNFLKLQESHFFRELSSKTMTSDRYMSWTLCGASKLTQQMPSPLIPITTPFGMQPISMISIKSRRDLSERHVEKSVFSIWVDLLLCRSIQLLVLSYAEMFVYMYLSQLMSTFTNYLKVHHLLDGFFIP